ncbi:helix-turn-helix transcriptional regulator [Vallitalea pronyensis]|uniref:Helix-turn-helix transcriptional regulator n=1 Tax=Vallitalea pronyensis TaxID=1348613 RepID=A0A8J8SIQ3_9FIRM|nr:helix-turn-helix transcriptional regulator [Vallitalea pronyensis]QUI24687.1 helix-turn-helix transcriptional regulator [Vallitalea pronyensis]
MKKNFTKLFIKFFMPYLLIIIIMSALGSIAYIAAFREIESNAIKMQQSYIEQSKSVLDRRFKEAMDASIQLQQIPIVNGFKKRTRFDIEENYYPVVELYNQLKNIRFVNDIIEQYFIFYDNSKVVASNANINYYNKLSPDNFKVGTIDKDVYWESLFKKYYNGHIQPVENYMIYKKPIRGISILTTIGHEFNSPEAVILMILDGEKLKQNMTGFEQNLEGNFFVADAEGRILISLNDELGITENGYVDFDTIKHQFLTFTTPSEVTSWNYILIQSEDEVFREIFRLRNAASILMATIFVVGLLTSLISARYNSKPVHTLMNKHEDLVQRVKKQIPYLRMTFLERWLMGNYTNIEEIISMTKYLKANYIGTLYCVMVVDYDERINILEDLSEHNINELEMKRLIVKDLLTEEILLPEYVHDIDHDKLAVIFITDGTDENQFRKHIEEQICLCIDLMASNSIKDVRFGVGNIYKDMAEVSSSLSNAMDALTTINTKSEKGYVWFDTLEENLDSYYYPAEIENRLYNCTRAGDSEQVRQILRDIIKRNIFDKTLPANMMKVFIYEIWGTLAKVQERAVGEDNVVKSIILEAFEKMDSMSNLEKIQCSKRVFLEVCEVIRNEREDKHDHIMDSINQYIDESYQNPDFCLPMVAEKFNLSYAYLSQIFKAFNNECFINYLQQLRMKEAERLLRETNMAVKDIVIACGYNSSNTFGKAFKRMHGISASVYREKQQAV